MPSKPKTNRKETTEAERKLIWAHYLDGMSYSQIRTAVKKSRSTIASIVQRMKERNETDRFINANRPGAPQRIDSRGERALIRHADQNPRDTLAALGTPSKSGYNLSRSTVRKILKCHGKNRRRARKKPYLKKEHKKGRLRKCKGFRGIDPMRICFSDEATFEIGNDGTVVYVTRAPGEEYEDRMLKPSFKSGRTSISVWSAFCGREMGPIVILPKGERMNQQRYKDEILKKHFIPFYRRMNRLYGTRKNPVYMQEDGASYHTGGIPSTYRRNMRVRSLDWPAQSPDLSPIENIWRIVKRVIAKRRHRVKTIKQMEIAVVEEMSRIPEEVLETLAKSFTTRIEMCIKNKGGATKY